jgi:hypothetical protein
VDMAEETGERRLHVRIVCEVVYADKGKLPDDAVKGRHLVMHFIYSIPERGGSSIAWNKTWAGDAFQRGM